MRALCLALSLGFAACGRAESTTTQSVPPAASPDKRVMTALNEYLTVCRQEGLDCPTRNLTISFGEIPAEYAGLCTMYTTGPVITLALEAKTYSDGMFKALIWHEAEHCIRGIQHTEGDAPHIMRSRLMNDDELKRKPMLTWLREAFRRPVHGNTLSPIEIDAHR